jgi:hypothetical protein
MRKKNLSVYDIQHELMAQGQGVIVISGVRRNAGEVAYPVD